MVTLTKQELKWLVFSIDELIEEVENVADCTDGTEIAAVVNLAIENYTTLRNKIVEIDRLGCKRVAIK